jgi:AhpD family alkylhydroperoxidase
MSLRHRLIACCLAFVVSPLTVPSLARAQQTPALATLPELEAAARARVGSEARVPLRALTTLPDDPALRLYGPEAPNVVKAMGTIPEAARPMADMLRAVIFEGGVASSTRAAMGLRIAQIVGSPYVAAHMVRLIVSAPDEPAWRRFFQSGDGAGLTSRQRLAIGYAESLTRDIHGVTDEQFATVHAEFTDNEIVELTITTAFFNHLTRFAETTRLPLESWAFDKPSGTLPWVVELKAAPRVGLISDGEIAATAAAAAAARDPAAQRGGLGLGMANSMRAMFRAPGLAVPWRALGQALREKEQVGRDVKLQVSLAVSTLNGCRYCVRHQVLGLRRLGVDPARLVALQKDDAALTPRERLAVLFARQVTTAPAKVTDAEWSALGKEFGERGNLEVLLQTCTFAFMNRFTDGLRLPSEDEAIKVYQETYGTSAGPIRTTSPD